MSQWHKIYDLVPLSELLVKLVKRASSEPGKAQSATFKGKKCHIKLLEAGEENGLDELWKVGISVQRRTFPARWEWNIFIHALPWMIINEEDIEVKKEKILETKLIMSAEFRISHRWKVPEEMTYG